LLVSSKDLTELDRESSLKPGKERSEVKTAALLKRLDAARSALNDLAAYYTP